MSDMIYPTIDELTKGQFNRYELVIATAKCARLVTDEYVRQREVAERFVGSNKDTDRTIASMIKKEYRDEKAVKNAINRLVSGEFRIVSQEETAAKKAAEEAAREAELAAAAEVPESGDETAEGEPDSGADA